MVSIATRTDLADATAGSRPWRSLLGRSIPDEAVRGAVYDVAFVNSTAEIPDELWTAGFPAPLEGRWWYEVLEQSALESQFTSLYARISRNGVPVGVAPCFVMDVPLERVTPEKLLKPLRAMAQILPSILYQRTLFVGSPSSNESTIGLLPGVDRREVLLALQIEFERKARELGVELIVWKDMPASVWPDLDWLMTRRRLFRTVGLPGTLVRFSSHRKDDYFKQLKGSRRYILKKKLKLSASQVDLAVEVFQHPTREVLDEIYGLFWQTYSRAKTRFEELNQTWFARVAELPTTHFIVLREKHTGAMIAFMLCFDCGSRLINKYVGFDYSRPKSWTLYFRLWDATVEWALAQGYTSIQSGTTAYRAKIEMGHDLVPLVNYLRHRNMLLHAIYGRIVRNLDWAKLDDDLAVFLRAHPEARAMSLPAPRPRQQRVLTVLVELCGACAKSAVAACLGRLTVQVRKRGRELVQTIKAKDPTNRDFVQ
jgi:Acetyltransferase (GNAT) domain